MHGYLKRLVDERNSLTGLIQQLNDTAEREERQLTDPEAERQRGWQQRCAELDPLIIEQNEYLTTQRSWAKLQNDLSVNDPQPVQSGGGGRAGTALATRAPASTGLVTPEGWGEVFTRSAQIEEYDGHGHSERVELPGIFQTRAPIDTNYLDLPPAIFTPAPWHMTTPLLDAIGHETISTGSVEWVIWPPSFPLAQVVDEGQLKPEATFAPTVKAGSLETVAHYKGITRQALEDIPRIQQIVESTLRGGVLAKLEGLASDALTADTDITEVDTDDLMTGIRVALGNVQAAGYASANAILLNPADFASLDIAVMAATVAGPQLQNSFWGLRAIAVGALPAGTAYVGDFKTGLTMFDRGSTSAYVTDSHADMFLRNILVILAETRALAVVTEPQAIQKVVATPATEAVAAAPATKGNGGK